MVDARARCTCAMPACARSCVQAWLDVCRMLRGSVHETMVTLWHTPTVCKVALNRTILCACHMGSVQTTVMAASQRWLAQASAQTRALALHVQFGTLRSQPLRSRRHPYQPLGLSAFAVYMQQPWILDLAPQQ